MPLHRLLRAVACGCKTFNLKSSRYSSAFIPPSRAQPLTPPLQSSKRKSPRKSSVVPYGPGGHYALTQRSTTPHSASLPNLTLSPPTLGDSIGRQLTGASFNEVGLAERKNDWELGDKIRVNEMGRLSKAFPSPDPTRVAFGVEKSSEEARRESEEQTVRPSTSSADRRFRNSVEGRSSEEEGESSSSGQERQRARENTIAFPTYVEIPAAPSPKPRWHETRFGGLATLSESEDETDEEVKSEDSSIRTARNNRGRNGPGRGVEDDRMATPSMEDLPSIDTDSDEERYISSRTVAHAGADQDGGVDEGPRRSFNWRRKPVPAPLATSADPLSTPFTDTPLVPILKKPSQDPPVVEWLDESSHELQQYEPKLRSSDVVNPAEVEVLYVDIRHRRSELKRLNGEIGALQSIAMADIADGKGARGFILVGRGVGSISGVEKIMGRTKDDVRWDRLFVREEKKGVRRFWLFVALLSLIVATIGESRFCRRRRRS